ncbi:hypothetical protein [Sphingomonas sp. SORGH_AS_0879]|nr:hypothetical protein [Sphingomonas sp. SORGH_AS_0879]MDQ1230781.1 hypothetical protein [Sphingomonas sp. SORGH_AS_0879]
MMKMIEAPRSGGGGGLSSKGRAASVEAGNAIALETIPLPPHGRLARHC